LSAARGSEAAPRRVAIVGGGWAGLAAAVTLARSGHPVTVFEQGRTLGGRARRVVVDGVAIDNGQHLLIGAYRQTRALVATVHDPAPARPLLHRLPLTIVPFGDAPDAVTLRAWPLPAPLHLAAGLLAARGLSWSERVALARGLRNAARCGFRCAPDSSVAERFAATPARAFDAVWAPLCLAALNTPPSRASAAVFATVLREAFAGHAGASDFLVPACDLSTLFPEAAARYLAAHRGEVRTGHAVHAVSTATDGALVRTASGEERFAAALVAVGPHQLAAAVGDAGADAFRPACDRVAAFAYESITTAYLAYPGEVMLPARIARLDDAPGQWVFDRSDAPGAAANGAQSLLAVIISAGGPHDRQDHRSLAAAIDAQLRRLRPTLPAPRWSRVIAERRATYACTPALARPVAGRVAPRLYLAGDYTEPELPPTLEAATRSGVAAARALAADLGAAAR